MAFKTLSFYFKLFHFLKLWHCDIMISIGQQVRLHFWMLVVNHLISKLGQIIDIAMGIFLRDVLHSFNDVVRNPDPFQFTNLLQLVKNWLQWVCGFFTSLQVRQFTGHIILLFYQNYKRKVQYFPVFIIGLERLRF